MSGDGPIQSWPDPGVVVGPYRILPRTCGDFAVYDDRAPLGKMTAGGGGTIAEAKAVAIALVAEGSPIRPVDLPVPAPKAQRAPSKKKPAPPARKGT